MPVASAGRTVKPVRTSSSFETLTTLFVSAVSLPQADIPCVLWLVVKPISGRFAVRFQSTVPRQFNQAQAQPLSENNPRPKYDQLMPFAAIGPRKPNTALFAPFMCQSSVISGASRYRSACVDSTNALTEERNPSSVRVEPAGCQFDRANQVCEISETLTVWVF
jgi:hypothetical protein